MLDLIFHRSQSCMPATIRVAPESGCGEATIQVARKEQTTCIWQDGHAVVDGVGYGISPAETIKLTAVAETLLQLG